MKKEESVFKNKAPTPSLAYVNKKDALRAVNKDEYGIIYQCLSAELKNDMDIIEAVLKKNGTSLKYMSDRSRGDIEIVCLALQQDYLAMQFINENLWNVKTSVLRMLRLDQDGSGIVSFTCVSNELKSDPEVVKAAFKNTVFGLSVYSIPKELHSVDFFLELWALVPHYETLENLREVLGGNIKASLWNFCRERRGWCPLQADAFSRPSPGDPIPEEISAFIRLEQSKNLHNFFKEARENGINKELIKSIDEGKELVGKMIRDAQTNGVMDVVDSAREDAAYLMKLEGAEMLHRDLKKNGLKSRKSEQNLSSVKEAEPKINQTGQAVRAVSDKIEPNQNLLPVKRTMRI